jgi:hypothetical protein
MLDWLTWGPILIFLCDERGRRSVHGGAATFRTDPHWRDHVRFSARLAKNRPWQALEDLAASGIRICGPETPLVKVRRRALLGGGRRASAVRMLTLAVAIVVVVVLGALWRRPSPPSSPPAVAKATTTPSHAKSIARPSDLETALAELDRLRRAEGRAHLALLAIERTAKEAANAAKTAASAKAPGIWSDLRAEAQREYEEAQRQRAEFEFQLRAQYGDLPR